MTYIVSAATLHYEYFIHILAAYSKTPIWHFLEIETFVNKDLNNIGDFLI